MFEAYQRVAERVDEVDDVLLLIPQRPEKLRLLAGNSGVNSHWVKWVSAESGVRIWVPEPQDASPVVALEGSMEAVRLAFAIISERLFSGATKQVTRITDVPTSMVGILLGPKGAALAAIRQLTGCNLDLVDEKGRKERGDGGGGDRAPGERQHVKISGMADCYELALKIVKRLAPEKKEENFIHRDDCIKAGLGEARGEGLYYPCVAAYVQRFSLALPPAATGPINPYLSQAAASVIEAELKRIAEAEAREKEAALRKGAVIRTLAGSAGAGSGSRGADFTPRNVLIRPATAPLAAAGAAGAAAAARTPAAQAAAAQAAAAALAVSSMAGRGAAGGGGQQGPQGHQR